MLSSASRWSSVRGGAVVRAGSISVSGERKTSRSVSVTKPCSPSAFSASRGLDTS